MAVEFDLQKRNETLRERGLDMARADRIFEGPTLTLRDERHDYGEVRFITLGYLDQRMVVMVWTERNKTRRVISLRKANEREQKIYAPRMA